MHFYKIPLSAITGVRIENQIPQQLLILCSYDKLHSLTQNAVFHVEMPRICCGYLPNLTLILSQEFTKPPSRALSSEEEATFEGGELVCGLVRLLKTSTGLSCGQSSTFGHI